MQEIRKHEELTLYISSRSGTNSAVCSANSSDFNIGAAAAAVQGHRPDSVRLTKTTSHSDKHLRRRLANRRALDLRTLTSEMWPPEN